MRLLVPALCLICTTAVAAPPPTSPLTAGNTRFALELYGQVRSAPGNVCFSPASISTALAMAFAGARGATARQMARTLHFDLAPAALHAAFGALLTELRSDAAGSPRLLLANRLWVQAGRPLAAAFLELTGRSYGAAAEMVDFAREPAARHAINRWVEEHTAGVIKDLIPAGLLDADTRLVLTNAVYFKAEWVTPFAPGHTTGRPFHPAPGRSKDVPTMSQAMPAGYGETEALQVLELPYRTQVPSRDLAMVVVLPRTVDGLAAVERELTPARLAAILALLRPQRVSVELPRFKVNAAVALRPILARLGMPLAFDGRRADFSGITATERLHLSAVLHRAFVTVDEQGTEAAAATGPVMSHMSMARRSVAFRADHPFLFFIRDRGTGTILFLGRLVDPV
jgi:serpin B